MIQEQAILNIIHECGIRLGSYNENCVALLLEAQKQWQPNEAHKLLTPFVHTNVVVNDNQTKGTITATATVFYPFMLKNPRKATKTTTAEPTEFSLLDLANENADFISASISAVERNLSAKFLAMQKQGRSVFDLNFSNKYFEQKDKTMLANFFIFAYVCDYQLQCEFQSNI